MFYNDILRKIFNIPSGFTALARRTNFRDMTKTRWRERGLVADWLEMAAVAFIGWRIFGAKFRLVEQPDGGK